MKRGQITVFIILGLLIVFAVGTIIYLNAGTLESTAVPQVQEVAEEAKPVQDYITECLNRIGVEALQQVGSFGGHLSPVGSVNPPNPTEADALSFSTDGDYSIPYWWHMKSRNNCQGGCQFASSRPALTKNRGSPSIEAALETYVAENLDNCIKDFKELDQFTIEADEDREVRVFITEEDVTFSLEQEFLASSGAGRNVLDTFVTTVPVHLKDLYDLATNITVLEQENSFLGKHARELISAFSATDSSKLPPVGTTEMELGPGTIWVKQTVQERLMTLLQSYVPLLQVFGTGNYHPLEVPANSENRGTIENALNRNALIPQLKAFPHLQARFTYLSDWNPYFDLNCDGQVCRPESLMNTYGPVFGLQRYNFAYDLSYPVMVELWEPDALNGKGYTFRFALEGNMRNNEPLTSDWEQPDIPPSEQQASQLCDESQRTSGEVSISLFDTVTREPVDGALTFDCGVESCDIGSTVDGKLSTRLPRCIGGRLSAVQIDYISDVIDVESATDAEQTVELAMNPIVNVNVTARKYQLRKDPVSESWQFNSERMLFTGFDQAIISLTRNPENGQQAFGAFSSVCGSSLYKGDRYSRDVRITPGNYTVSVSTLYHDNVTIPVDRRCITIKKTFSSDKKCYNIPSEPISFGGSTKNACVSEKPFPSGNIQYAWEITPQMLRNARTIIFPTIVVAAEIPGTRLVVEDMNAIAQTQAYADGEPALIIPEVLP